MKCCIFDLDGTLVDSLASLWYCGNHALKDHGMEELPKELYKTMVGDGAAVLVKRMIENAKGDLEKYDSVFAAYKAYFKDHCMYEAAPYPHIPELVMELKRRGIKLAVLSNKPDLQTKSIIAAMFGEESFDLVFGQREGVAKKPAPDGVFEILKELQVTIDQVLYLGDTNTDMMTGNNAGVKTVGVLWGFREEIELREYGAHIIVKDPLEILEYLE